VFPEWRNNNRSGQQAAVPPNYPQKNGTFGAMPDHLINTLRLLAAILVTFSGAGKVASLWFRELDQQAVAALLLGTVYLIIGLGLFGQSRFTLFVAISVCSLVSLYTLKSIAVLEPLQQAGLAADLITIVLSTTVLWHVRNRPSV
jgi:hypothetical protein